MKGMKGGSGCAPGKKGGKPMKKGGGMKDMPASKRNKGY